MTIVRSPLQGHSVVVLGMHRSGTSVVAAGLAQLGVRMGRSLAAGDPWNPKGYFEERRIVEFNDQLLALAGRRWDSPLPPAPVAQWQPRREAAAQLLETLFADCPAWGFKDPRMCLLAAFWQPLFAALPTPPKPLLVLRHPAEVAGSLARRDGIGARRASSLWFTHLLGSLEYLESTSQGRLVDFDRLQQDPRGTLDSLCQWLALPHDDTASERFAGEFIAPQLIHASRASAVHPLALRAYEYWRSAGAAGALDPELLHTGAWLDIRAAFEREIRPELAAVSVFFEGDRQLDFGDSRLVQTHQALAHAEQLAFERLEQTQALSGQLQHTTEAFQAAERLALQRQDELAALNVRLDTLATALRHTEGLLHEQRCALAAGTAIPAANDALQARIGELERLAIERLAALEALDRELQRRSARWAEVEQALREREHTLNQALARAEELALQRLHETQALDRQLKNTADALARAERLAHGCLANTKE